MFFLLQGGVWSKSTKQRFICLRMCSWKRKRSLSRAYARQFFFFSFFLSSSSFLLSSAISGQRRPEKRNIACVRFDHSVAVSRRGIDSQNHILTKSFYVLKDIFPKAWHPNRITQCPPYKICRHFESSGNTACARALTTFCRATTSCRVVTSEQTPRKIYLGKIIWKRNFRHANIWTHLIWGKF